MSGWSREIPQSEVEVQKAGKHNLEFFLQFCILRRLTCPRFCCIWAEADRQCPSSWATGAPKDSRSILRFSRHLLGFFPLRRQKVKEYKQKGKVHMCTMQGGVPGSVTPLCWLLDLLPQGLLCCDDPRRVWPCHSHT